MLRLFNNFGLLNPGSSSAGSGISAVQLEYREKGFSAHFSAKNVVSTLILGFCL